MYQEEFKEFYKRYPDKFIEVFYPDIKLYCYQKILLRFMAKYDSGYFRELQDLKSS